MKRNSKNFKSPKKNVDSGSDTELAAAGLRMVTIASPSTGLSPRKRAGAALDGPSPVKGSPQKRESSRLIAASGSPLKNSPLKSAVFDSGQRKCSPRKRLLMPADLSPGKTSPKPKLEMPGNRSVNLDDDFSCKEQCSPRKKSLSVISSPVKSSPRKKMDSPLKNVANSYPEATCEDQLTRLKSPRKINETTVLSPRSKRSWQGSSDCPGTEFDPVLEVQRVLRMRISQMNTPPSICGYEKERRQLYDLIKRTAVSGESNSMLLIGPRGCGKSMVIKDVIKKLYEDENIKQDLLLVQLNGLLQTDDRIALREITRQLQLENTVGDKVFGSFAETLQFLLEAIKKGNQNSKPILFVLEEFDLFAQHKNQTLLYNLFDISQSAQAPVCVIGVTCRLSLLDEVAVKDVLERQFSLMNDARGLLSLLTYPVCNISAAHPTISASDLITSFKLISTDTKSTMLHGVSILELAIIIAMKHLTDIYEGEPFNFEMVYSEYLKFARQRSGMQVYEKAIVMKAYEHLQTLELVRSHGSGGTSQKEYKLMNLLVHPAQIMDALQKYPNCPTEMKQWASQSIS
ncbi:origin recognition complex subunit 4 [Plakobranchus ocellatus]|uniref:Origin recognition complex subunit 4 n=1 Tax=Plakobranchus ocellatus TaxID=259542 RepID=A0AAV4DVH7_9GAST|nr:origin recognition complex subunit 4 [Plakobranchus ocellatus]